MDSVRSQKFHTSLVHYVFEFIRFLLTITEIREDSLHLSFAAANRTYTNTLCRNDIMVEVGFAAQRNVPRMLNTLSFK